MFDLLSVSVLLVYWSLVTHIHTSLFLCIGEDLYLCQGHDISLTLCPPTVLSSYEDQPECPHFPRMASVQKAEFRNWQSNILGEKKPLCSNIWQTILNNDLLRPCEWDWGIVLISHHLVIPDREALYESVSSRCRKIKWNRCYANAGRLSVSVIDGGLSLQRWPWHCNFKC